MNPLSPPVNPALANALFASIPKSTSSYLHLHGVFAGHVSL